MTNKECIRQMRKLTGPRQKGGIEMNIIGKKYRNLVTGNTYECIGYDGNQLTLSGIGKIKVTFHIAWWIVCLKYREVKEGGIENV
jgi:hypothetical protein